MGFTIAEKWNGRVRNNADMEREYIVRHDGIDDSDETSAAEALFAYLAIPANIPGIDLTEFPQTDISVREIVGSDPVTFMGRGVWATKIKTPAGTVQPPTPVDVNEITFSFNSQAQGAHIWSSIQTQWAKYMLHLLQWPNADPSDADTYNNLINVEGEGKDLKIKGLDLTPPPTTFEISWVLPKTTVTAAFILDLMSWVGTVNMELFELFGHEFLPGELFFSGVQGSRRTNEDWELSVGFSFSRDRQTDKVVVLSRNGTDVLVPRRGHEYIWIYNLPAWDDTNKMFSKPGKKSAVYVEQVWEEKEWELTSLDGLQGLTLN